MRNAECGINSETPAIVSLEDKQRIPHFPCAHNFLFCIPHLLNLPPAICSLNLTSAFPIPHSEFRIRNIPHSAFFLPLLLDP